MARAAGDSGAPLSPDEAFAVLGDATRFDILRTLADAGGPVPFTALRERVGVRDSGQFNYHLGRLAGHFVEKSDDGYILQQAGERVVQAVLSGAVTGNVVIEPAQVADGCPYCRADIEVSYREERLLMRCTSCVGSFTGVISTSRALGTNPQGTIALLYLPYAAVEGRDPLELLERAHAWSYVEHAAVANGLCPRCSGSIEPSVVVCADHAPDDGVCSTCNHAQYSIVLINHCPTCRHQRRGPLTHQCYGHPGFRAFFESRDIDPLAPALDDLPDLYNFDEEVLETDPFDARYTFATAGDELEVTVGPDLHVVAARER